MRSPSSRRRADLVHWWLMYTGLVVVVEMRVGADGVLGGSGGRGRWCRLYIARSSRAAKSESASDASSEGESPGTASPSSRMGSQIDFRAGTNPNEACSNPPLNPPLRPPNMLPCVVQFVRMFSLSPGPTTSDRRDSGGPTDGLCCQCDKRACIHPKLSMGKPPSGDGGL